MDVRELPATSFTRHPWEVARAHFFVRLLAEAGLLDGRARVVDVGAGDGYVARRVLEQMGDDGHVVCFDAHYPDATVREPPGDVPPGLSFTNQRPEGRFTLLLLLDVLEHVRNDRDLLSELVADLLEPGGRVLLSVPAWPGLFTRHDVLLGHCRRYRPRELREVAQAAGLQVQRSGSLFGSLLPARGLSKLGELARGVRSVPGAEEAPAHADTGIADWRGGRLLTGAVLGGLGLDGTLSRAASSLGVPWPGLSTWLIGGRS